MLKEFPFKHIHEYIDRVMNSILLNLSSDNRTTDSLGSDDFVIQFASPIKLGDLQWELSVVSVNFWNSNPNVSGPLYNNNYFDYSPDGGATWKTITFLEGTYSVQGLQSEIARQVTSNGDIAANIVFSPNNSTLRVELQILGTYQVDLGTGSLLYELLGFTPAQIAAPFVAGFYVGGNVANLNRGINQIYLRSDLIDPQGSYDSKVGSDVLTDCAFQGRPSGASVTIEKKYQIWLPVKKVPYIESVRIRLSDQLGRRYSIRDEPLSVQLNMRVSKVEKNRKIFENFAESIQKSMVQTSRR